MLQFLQKFQMIQAKAAPSTAGLIRTADSLSLEEQRSRVLINTNLKREGTSVFLTDSISIVISAMR